MTHLSYGEQEGVSKERHPNVALLVQIKWVGSLPRINSIFPICVFFYSPWSHLKKWKWLNLLNLSHRHHKRAETEKDSKGLCVTGALNILEHNWIGQSWGGLNTICFHGARNIKWRCLIFGQCKSGYCHQQVREPLLKNVESCGNDSTWLF